MRHLRDFLHPVWRDAFKDDKYSDKTELNQAVLDVFDDKLQKVEDDTIHSKEQSFLQTASDEWLDYWGSWFGLKREKKQSDTDYRQALLNHVVHARDTVPALRESIANFLKTNMADVQIYEPYTDVFFLDDSSLDSNKKLISQDYYTYGIIDIEIAVPFPTEVIDIINWFRPAGVLWVLTYRPSLDTNAPIWNLPPYNANLAAKLLTFTYKTGFDKKQSYSLTPNSKYNNGVTQEAFFTDDSYLNSLALLLGSEAVTSSYYNAIGYLNGLIIPSKGDTVKTLSRRLNNIPPKDNYLIEKKDNLSKTFNITRNNENNTNLLKDTFDFNAWYIPNSTQYSNDRRLSGANILAIQGDGQSFTKNQDLNLVVGEEYTISLQAKLKYPAQSNAIKLMANIDRGHTDLVITDSLSTNWKTYSVTFKYRGNTQDSLTITGIGDFSVAREVQISNIQVERGKVATPWSKSFNDINTEISDGYTYVYTLFDVHAFYYNQIESEGALKSRIGFDSTNDEINKAMDRYLEQKHIVADYHIDNSVKDNTHTQMMAFNYTLNMWVNFGDDNVSDQSNSINFKFNAMESYMNDSGLMVIAFRTETLDNDFKWDLNEIQLNVVKTYPYKNSINIYANYVTSATELLFQTLVGTDRYGNSNNDTDTMLYDRFQQHYPIRYIKNIIKKVHLYDDDNNANGFRLNNSNLNGDKNSPYVLPADKDPYSLYTVIPKYYEEDKDIPLVSVSILGASIDDTSNKNILGNLLQGGIYSTVIENLWRSNSSTTIMKHTDFNGSRLGLKISNDSPKVTDTLFIDSQSTYKEQAYKYSMQLKSDTLASMRVKILLISNDYKYPVLDTTVEVTNEYQPYSFKFNTNKVFADTIRIELIPDTKTAYDYEIAETRLGLDTKVYVDNEISTKNSPQIIPKQYPVREVIDGTVDASSGVEDRLGSVTYDDIEFDAFKYVEPTTTTTTSSTTNKDTTTTTTPTTTLKPLAKFILDISNMNDSSFGLLGNLKDIHTTSTTSTTSTTTINSEMSTTTKTTYFPYIDAIRKFNSGIVDTPLTYTDKQAQEITYDMMDKMTVDQLPDFRTIFGKQDITQDEVNELLNYLNVYKYHLISSGSDKIYDFQDYLDNGTTWLDLSGFQAQGLEHSVIVDLGNVHTDISNILIHHGSDSNLRVQYDSLVQTSVDGKHWTTWYDNYKGVNGRKDSYYIEPQAKPEYIPIGSYNSLQQHKDLGLPIPQSELANGIHQPIDYVSTSSVRLPALSMSKLLLNDSVNNINKSLVLSTSEYQNTIQRYQGIRSETIYSPYEIMKRTMLIPTYGRNLIVAKTIKNNCTLASRGAIFGYLLSFTTDYIPVVANQRYTISVYGTTDSCTSRIAYYDSSKNFISRETDTTISTGSSEVIVIPSGASYIKSSPDTPDKSGKYEDNFKIEIGSVPTPWTPAPEDEVFNNDTTDVDNISTDTTTKWWTTIHNTTTSTASPIDKTSLMILNRSILDGNDYLAGTDVGTTTTSTTTIKPTTNKPYKQQKELHLVSVDILRLVSQALPTLWENIGTLTDSEKLNIIKDFLVDDSSNILSLDVNATAPHGYTVSIWNESTKSWNDKVSTYSDSNTTLTLNSSNLDDSLTNLGIVYFMVSSATMEKSANISDLFENGYFTIYPNGLDRYNDGLYPHRNLALDTDRQLTLLGHGDEDILKLYPIKSNAFNHKVRVSFNLNSTGNLGTFDITSNDFDISEEYKDIPIESNNQHYSFIFNLPYPVGDNPCFNLILRNSMSMITVSGFKIEYGVEESPYVSSANSIEK